MFLERSSAQNNYIFSLNRIKTPPERAASHRDLYAPKRIFFPNTASKCHGRRRPCRGILSCLVKKSLVLECCAVLNKRFCFTAVAGDRRNTGCITRAAEAAVEEKIHSKPYKSLCESAQGGVFIDSIINIHPRYDCLLYTSLASAASLRFCRKVFVHTWESVDLRMGQKLRCLHPHQKIRNRCKLHTVHRF